MSDDQAPATGDMIEFAVGMHIHDEWIEVADSFGDALRVSVGQLPSGGVTIVGLSTHGPTGAPMLPVPMWRQLVRAVEDRLTDAYIPWHCGRCDVTVAMQDLPTDEGHACSVCGAAMSRARPERVNP